ncbi:MAG TPA: helix-turn-helix domain-containing protein [Saprospiraceae bacterium]|nr:helix-turn-helix domain-containing protein [Saprospiraceae bacterium]HMQ83152.1 helix-turn-helix domain-containing protein [Saprospiraceae bacterium]
MRKIAVLVPKGETMSSAVVAPNVIFTKVNDMLTEMGQAPAFEVQFVGCQKNLSLDGGTFWVKPHRLLPQAGGYDLVLLPGFTGEVMPTLSANKPLIAWLKKQRLEYGTELASLCSGAFFIAATGLAEGKKMTTHWAYAEAFRALFPEVKLLPDRIVTDDGGIYASGGAYSSLNLVLYLLEKFCGKSMAIWASKVFQIDIQRASQKPFLIFNGQKSHIDEQIKTVQDFIESNYHDTLTVNNLAHRFLFSRRNFLRRFKDATGNTPIEYLQRVRIEAAKRLLEHSPKNVGEVVSEVGYADEKTFRILFKKHTGFSPFAYRERYRQA